MKQSTKSKTIGWIASIGFHAAILCLIGYYAYFVTFTVEGDVRIEGTRQPVPESLKTLVRPPDDGSLLSGTDRRLAEQLATRDGTRQALEQAGQAAEKMTDQQKMQTLETHAGQIEAIRSQNLSTILAHVEAAAGIAPEKKPLPQYEADIAAAQAAAKTQGTATTQPAAAPKGFDIDSSELTDILMVKTSQGKIVYLWTLTDSAGIKESFEIAHEQMDDEQLRMAELFERARRYPNFNQVFRTALKLASKRAKEDAAAAKPRN